MENQESSPGVAAEIVEAASRRFARYKQRRDTAATFFRLALPFLALLIVGGAVRAYEPQPEEVLARIDAAFGSNPAAKGARTPACLNGLITDLLRVLPRLTSAQQDHVATLSPTLSRMVVRRRLAAAGISLSPQDLPTYNLPQTLIGKNVVVHYTFQPGSPDLCPSEAYANEVGAVFERAVQIEGGFFGKAIPSGPDGKLHIFIRSLTGTSGLKFAADAITVPDTEVPPGSNSYSVYVEVSNALISEYADGWPTALQGEAFHEYMHGIQDSYNKFSDTWLHEGQATWIESALVAQDPHLQYFLTASDSVVNQPNLALSEVGTTGYRPYSTALFMFYLEDTKGAGIMKSWLAATRTTNDATQALQMALGGKGKIFSDIYRNYLVALYRKQIRGVAPAIIPNVPVTPFPIGALPAPYTGAVPPTGALYYSLAHDAVLPASSTFAITTVNPAASGHPEAILLGSSSADLAAPGVPGAIAPFTPGETAVVILTDVTAPDEGNSDTPTTIAGQLFCPQIDITAVNFVENPVDSLAFKFTLTYNLTGLPSSITTFGGFLLIVNHEIMPSHPSITEQLSVTLTPGTNQSLNIEQNYSSDSHNTHWTAQFFLLTPSPNAYYGSGVDVSKAVSASKTGVNQVFVGN